MALNQKKVGIVSGVVVGIILCNETGRIILVEDIVHDTRMKKIPGGTIISGETAEVALAREILRKTGIVIDENYTHFLFEHEAQIKKPSYWCYVCIVKNFNNLCCKPLPDNTGLLPARAYTPDAALMMINGDPLNINGRLTPFHQKILTSGLRCIEKILRS